MVSIKFQPESIEGIEKITFYYTQNAHKSPVRNNHKSIELFFLKQSKALTNIQSDDQSS